MSDQLKLQQFEAEVEADMTAPDNEAHLLMSLALDGLLDADDQARLNLLLAGDESLQETWRQWQRTDALLQGGGKSCAVPQPGFVARFEATLQRHEQRQLARRRMLVGAAAVFAWLGVLAAAVAAGYVLLSSQTQWMNDFVRELVYYPSAASIWLRAVRSSLGATISEPQTVALVACYALASAVLLSIWLWFLRRTTHEEVVS